MAIVTVNSRPTSRYRAPVTARHAPPIPPNWLAPLESWRAPPSFQRFVVLSLLLHALFIVLFGAPSGGSSEGRAMWGSMQVELRGLLVEPERAPAVALRAEEPSAETPAPTRQDRGPSEGAVPMTPPADTQATAAAPLGPAIVEVPTPFPRLLDRLPSSEIPLADPPALKVPPPTEGQDLRPPPRERPAPSPIEVPAPLPVVPAPSAERALAEPPALAIPLAEPLPQVPAPTPAPAPVEVQQMPELPAPQATRPVEVPAVEVTAIPVPPLDGVAPSAPQPLGSIELAPLPRIEAAAPPAPMQPPPVAPTPVAPEPQLAPRIPSPAFGPPSGRPAPERRPGDTPGDYDPTAPALDPDALRRRAGSIAREGSGQRALLPFAMPPVPDKKSRLESAIENARKPDCRTAYQSLGLAAIVPLIANELGEGNCRW